MKEELEKAAIEYQKRKFPFLCWGGIAAEFRSAFQAGAEWQAKQYPWISVDERFPENKETVLVSSQIYGNIVLTWDELGMDW